MPISMSGVLILVHVYVRVLAHVCVLVNVQFCVCVHVHFHFNVYTHFLVHVHALGLFTLLYATHKNLQNRSSSDKIFQIICQLVQTRAIQIL
jgi:hypothetical protein